MSYDCPTVRIATENEQGFIIINESDFDDKIHKLFGITKEELAAKNKAAKAAAAAEAAATEALIAEQAARDQAAAVAAQIAVAQTPAPVATDVPWLKPNA